MAEVWLLLHSREAKQFRQSNPVATPAGSRKVNARICRGRGCARCPFSRGKTQAVGSTREIGVGSAAFAFLGRSRSRSPPGDPAGLLPSKPRMGRLTEDA